MQGGGRETIAADLGDEYAARFGLRDLVEAWIDRVMHELPTDPYEVLMEEAGTQRQLGGGVVTCPNTWCGMSMPGYVYQIHRTLCSAQEHWTRCVRCNERIEAARLSKHLMTCRAEPCRFCGGLSLPRMMHLCPIQQLFEADRATNALRYRRHRKEALELEAATAGALVSPAADMAPLLEHSAHSGGGADGRTAEGLAAVTAAGPAPRALSPIETAAATAEVTGASEADVLLTSPPFGSLGSNPLNSPALPDQRPVAGPSTADAAAPAGADEGHPPSHSSGHSPSVPQLHLSPTQREHLSCIQRLWRRNMVSERYRVTMLSKVWEDLDMYEERMGVSQSLDGGGFLERIVENLNSSEQEEEADQDDLDDALAHSYNHPISSNVSSYGDEDDLDDPAHSPRTHGAGGLHTADLAELAADSFDEDTDASNSGADMEVRSFHGILRKGSFAIEAPDVVVTASSGPASPAKHHRSTGAAADRDDDDEDDDYDTDNADDDNENDEDEHHSQRLTSFSSVTGGRTASVSARRRSKQRRKPQQLWLRVSTTPDVNGAYMSEESMWALTRLSGHREIFRASLVVAIVRAATRILLERPVVQRITTPPRGSLVVVGDLHGQMKDLLHLLRVTGGPSPARYFVFNGDLVDRGPYGCEVIVHVFALLCTYPRYVYINRGNHEDRRTNQEYGFLAELFGKYGVKSSRIHRILADSYTAMPLMTIVDQRYCIVHGGVPRVDCTLQDIEDIGRVKHIPVVEQKTLRDRLLVDLLWNDPVEKYQSRQIGDRHQGNGWRSSKRGCGAEYLLNITSRFLKRNGLSMVIRSHDVKPGGFEMIHNNQCVTVFSASNYAGVSGNRGAVAILQTESKYPTYQTWLLQKDTVIRRRPSAGEADGDAGHDGASSSNLTEDEFTDTEDLLEEDPRAVHDEFVRSFYGEHALVELVRAFVDFTTQRSRQPSLVGGPSRTTSGRALNALESAPSSSTSARHSIITTTATGADGKTDGALRNSGPDAAAAVSAKMSTAFRLSTFMSEPTILQQLKTIRMLRDLIYLNRYSLLVAFNGVDEMRTGVVYKVEWCVVMREVTDLDVPWYYLCQFLAPRLVLDGIPAVEYVRFLRHYDAPFAQDYRPEWQRSMIRRTFSDLDLPEDILRAFRVYDNTSNGASDHVPAPLVSLAPSQTSGVEADVSALLHDRLSSLPAVLSTGNNTASARAVSGLLNASSPSSTSLSPTHGTDRNNRTVSVTSVPSSSGARIGGSVSPPFLSPGSPAPLLTSPETSNMAFDELDISSITIDFVTFASRVRSISPVAATFEDSELYCLFRFFDTEMRGHVYLDDFIHQVNSVLNDDDADVEDSPAEVILSGEEIDFGCVSISDTNPGNRRARSPSSSSSSSDDGPSGHAATLSKKGAGGAGLLSRTASNVMAMRRACPPVQADVAPESPLALLPQIRKHDSEEDTDDARDGFLVSTDTRPFNSASARRLLVAPVVVQSSAPPSGSKLSLSDSGICSIDSGTGADSDFLHAVDVPALGVKGEEDRAARDEMRAVAAKTPIPPPVSQVVSVAQVLDKPVYQLRSSTSSGGTSSAGTCLTEAPNDNDNDVDAPLGLRKPHILAAALHGEATTLLDVRRYDDDGTGDPLASPPNASRDAPAAVSSTSSSLPTWVDQKKSVSDSQPAVSPLSGATTTRAALSILRRAQRDRAVRMPWLYPTLIRVQEQLMHRGSEERTYRVFRALNRNRDGKLTQKEFWGLVRFANTRVDKAVTEEQSNTIFQCIHDDNLLRVHNFCATVLAQLDDRANSAGQTMELDEKEATLAAPPRASISVTSQRASGPISQVEEGSIIMSRLRDEQAHGCMYVTALEFVSYFSVVVSEDGDIASSAVNTNTNTLMTDELTEQLRALRLTPCGSESFLDHTAAADGTALPRISKSGLTATTIGGVTLLSPAGVDGGRPVSHSSAAGDASISSLGRQHTNSTGTGPNNNKSFSSRSLSVALPGHLARLSAVSSNNGGASGSALGGVGTRLLVGDPSMATTLEHLTNLFHPDTTLAEMLSAFQGNGMPVFNPVHNASLSNNNNNNTNNGGFQYGAHPTMTVTPPPAHTRRPMRSFAVAAPSLHMPVMSLNSNGILCADPLGESMQTFSLRSNATTSTILSTPMQMQPAEHRITSNALFGTGGFGQSGMVPLRGGGGGGTTATTAAGQPVSGSAGASATGGVHSPVGRVSIVSLGPSPSGSFRVNAGLAAAAASSSSSHSKPPAKIARFNMTVPAPPSHGRGKRVVGGLGGSSASSSVTGSPLNGSHAPATSTTRAEKPTTLAVKGSASPSAALKLPHGVEAAPASAGAVVPSPSNPRAAEVRSRRPRGASTLASTGPVGLPAAPKGGPGKSPHTSPQPPPPPSSALAPSSEVAESDGPPVVARSTKESRSTAQLATPSPARREEPALTAASSAPPPLSHASRVGSPRPALPTPVPPTSDAPPLPAPAGSARASPVPQPPAPNVARKGVSPRRRPDSTSAMAETARADLAAKHSLTPMAASEPTPAKKASAPSAPPPLPGTATTTTTTTTVPATLAFVKASTTRLSRDTDEPEACSVTESLPDSTENRSTGYTHTAASTPSNDPLTHSTTGGRRGHRAVRADGHSGRLQSEPVSAASRGAAKRAPSRNSRSSNSNKGHARGGSEEVTAQRLPSLTTLPGLPSTSTGQVRRPSVLVAGATTGKERRPSLRQRHEDDAGTGASGATGGTARRSHRAKGVSAKSAHKNV